MKKNVGTTDRIVRILVAALIAFLFFKGIITGLLGLVFMVLALVFAATSILSFCPLYAIFGMSTCPPEKKD